ncbi:MAG: prolyl oligopeptidase family serine peptidase [Flexilinea sp.]
MKAVPFGLWKSPIHEDYVAQRGRLSGLKWDSNKASDTLVISGSKRGKGFLLEWSSKENIREINSEYPVGGTVGYGGGDFDVSDGNVVFCAGEKGLFSRKLGRSLIRELSKDGLFIASPAISPDCRYAAYITSDDKNDQIALIDLKGHSWPVLWIKGADFYMQPVWNPGGIYFAWVEWDHPFMPWDGSRVMLAEVDLTTGKIVNTRHAAGNEIAPASQPQFSPDGKKLSFIRSNGEWEDLVILDLMDWTERTIVHGEHFTLSVPAFSQGDHSYDWFGDSRQIAYTRIFGTKSSLRVIDITTNSEKVINAPEYTNFELISVSKNSGKIAAIVSGPQNSPHVICITGKEYSVIYRLGTDDLPVEFISDPVDLSWQSGNDRTIYGIYYPPKNPDYFWNGLPPALVHIHGGPTGKTDFRLNPEIQYFTSRGYGWFGVNYRGSHGYGRSYQRCLNGHWGEYDVEDAIRGADILGKMGLADRERMLIIGSSAGGYTVLNALVRFPDSFKAGASLYGVSNLYSLVTDTHKLEIHYTDELIGILPEAQSRFIEWSPIFHPEKIKAPLAIFQGDTDPVVIPAQSSEMAEKLKGPHVFRLYEGEGHGFRKPETIIDYLQTLSKFLVDYL